MSIKEIKLNRFDLGITDEKKDIADGYFYYLENVNTGEQISSIKQVPNIETTVNNRNMRSLLIVGGSIYGLGHLAPGGASTTIYKSIIGATGTTFGTITDGTATGYSFPVTATRPLLEYYYKDSNEEYIYYSSHGYIGKYNLSTSGNTPNVHAITSGGMNGGCFWQGNIYCWQGQIVSQFNVTTEDLIEKITIPTDQVIVDLVPFGNYLCIVCTSGINGNIGVTGIASKMYVWDGVTTTTFVDIVEIGYGIVSGADILDGNIYAVIGFPNQRGFRVKSYNGNHFATSLTYTGKRNTVSARMIAIPCSRVKSYTGYLYFLARITRPGSSYAYLEEMVLFRYGKKDSSKQDSFSAYKTMEITPQAGFDDYINDFVISEYPYYNVANSPDNVIIASIREAGSTMRIVTTDVAGSASVFTSQDAVIETVMYSGNDSSKEKYLKGISAYFSPLPTGGSVQIKYKKNEETTWTHIFEETTANTISHEAVNLESSGAILPIFRNIAFRVELGGGAELSGLKFRFEEEENLYGK